MVTGDARSLPQAAQAELRRKAVRAVRKGTSQVEVAAFLGVTAQTVCGWVKAHREGGAQALAARRRGRRPGEQMVLAPWQQAQIAKAIREKCPDQLKLPGFLWTREAVRELIERRFGVRLALTTVGNYLRRWGFTPQKPLRRAFEQDPAAVARWREIEFPKIASQAKRERARILWGDEMGLRSDHSVGRSFSPRDQTPAVKGTGQRFGANVISAIGNGGRLQLMVFGQRLTAAVFIAFLKRLARHAERRKVYLIVDGHPVHRAKRVRLWLQAHAEEIKLFHLPSYSPELNPDELLNQDVKSNALGRRRPRSQTELISDTRSHLRRRQRQPHIVADYFQEEHVRYAAAA